MTKERSEKFRECSACGQPRWAKFSGRAGTSDKEHEQRFKELKLKTAKRFQKQAE